MSSSSADLSTPQKILRSTFKSKLATDPSPPSYAPPPPPSSREEEDEKEEDGDVKMEEERVEEDTFANRCARRNIVSREDDDEGEGGGVTLKRSKVDTVQQPVTKEDKTRRVRSRFIEGSMRDRASIPPPRDMIGSESPDEDEDEDDDDRDDGDEAREKAEKEKKKRGFTFGLGSIFRFNPLALVDEAKAAYIRQKSLHEARERKKKELALRKKEAEEMYFRLKAKGELRGTFVRHIDDLVAEAVVADDDAREEPVFSDTPTGSARKRKYRELCSVGSEVDVVPPIPKPPPVKPEEEGMDDNDAMDTDAPDTIKSGECANQEAKPRPAGGSGGVLDLVKEKSRVFANTLSPSSTPTTPTVPSASTNGANGKVPSKRNVRKEERLAKKVSNLEQQLERARRELEEARAVPQAPVPKVPPPSALPHLTPHGNNGSSSDRRNCRAAPKEEEEGEEEGDTTMLDDEVSLVPLSSEISNRMAPPSRPPPPPPLATGTGEVYKPRPRRPGSRPRSSSSVSLARRVSSAASASAAVATNDAGEKHERKKRKGLMDSPPPPMKREGEVEVPPVPRVPEGWREAMIRG